MTVFQIPTSFFYSEFHVYLFTVFLKNWTSAKKKVLVPNFKVIFS